jgi:hypothetical protein
MKNWQIVSFLTFLILGIVLMSGCTSTAPTPQIVYVTVLVTPTPTVSAPAGWVYNSETGQYIQITPISTSLPVSISSPVQTTVLPTSDPIIGRWVRQYLNLSTNKWEGYEFNFYPDGSVVYNFGKPTMISSNIKIDPTFVAYYIWTSVGKDKYLIKTDSALVNGTSTPKIYREYTRVVTGEDPLYPGRKTSEYLVSTSEKAAFENNPHQGGGDNMPWLERAKTD